MPAQNLRLSDRQLKGVKPASKDYVLTDGDGLQLRVRSNGSLLWNFNYREPVTKKRINIGFGTYPELSLANARKMAVDGKPPAQPPLLGGCSQRQQLIQPAIRPGRQLLQRVFQPRTRLDTVQFGCRQQTLDRRRTPTRAL